MNQTIKKTGGTVMVCRIFLGVFVTFLFIGNAFAEWTVFEKAEEGSDWVEFRAVDKYEYAKNQVSASCVVRMWGGNYAVKIVDDATDNEEIFLCDDVNNEKEQKQTEASKGNKKEESDNEINLW